jgi:DinB superfamily
MVSDITSYLRFFDSVRRRTERDVAALPPEAAAWRPPPGAGGEAGWSIGDIVAHIGSTRLYFASAYRGEGWIATPPEIERADQRT